MPQKHPEVLAIIAATRPAQTVERIHDKLMAARTRQGRGGVSVAALRSWLSQLRAEGLVVRLTGDDAAKCGAFPEKYSPRTAFWISAENYRSYLPGAELPALNESAPAPRGTAPSAPAAAPSTEAASSAEDITLAILAKLDDERASVHKHITRLALQDPPDGSPESKLARSLVKLMEDLGQARWSFISAMSTPTTSTVPTLTFAEPQGKS